MIFHINKKKKSFLKYVNSKRRSKKNAQLLLDEAAHLKNKDEEKAKTLSAFAVSVLNINDSLGLPSSVSWRSSDIPFVDI